jgi:Type II restriction endonuclease EcoO109I
LVDHDDVVKGVAEETELFLARRLRKLRTEISGVLNVNPFLMCALQDFHQIKDQKSLAEYMLNSHLATGHSTGFGKMIDEKVLPKVFGTIRLDEKFRSKPPYNGEAFDDIDHLVTRSDGRHLLSLKASSWTIQYGQAMGIYSNFKKLGDLKQQQQGITMGVFYGHKGLLTDKYRIIKGENVRRQEILENLDYVEVRAGKDFWTWLNDDEPATQDWVLEGIQKGAKDFLKHNPGMMEVVGGAGQMLVKEFQKKYGLPQDGSLDWFVLLHAVNNGEGAELGGEALDEFTDSDDEG